MSKIGLGLAENPRPRRALEKQDQSAKTLAKTRSKPQECSSLANKNAFYFESYIPTLKTPDPRQNHLRGSIESQLS